MVFRLVRALGWFLCGIALSWILPLLPVSTRLRMTRHWYGVLLRALGVRRVVRGTAPVNAGLVVCNHVSWLDGVVLQAVLPMRVLAKREMRSWPVLGVVTARMGTLYIDRGRLSALPSVVRTISACLRSGQVVGAFPEGTTSCGVRSGAYRPAVFQAAIDADVPVHPLALRFRRTDGRPSTAALFVGRTSLLESLLMVTRTRGLIAEVSVLPPLDAGSVRDRRVLARSAESVTTAVVTRHPGAMREHDLAA